MIRVLIVDTGNEWGGGTQSLLTLVDRLDRSRFALAAAFRHDYQRGDGPSIGAVLAQRGVAFRRIAAPPPRRGKWLKELLRLLLCFHRDWRDSAIAAVDYRLKVLPEAAALAAVIEEVRPNLVYGNNQPSSNLSAMLAAEATVMPMVLHCRKAVGLSRHECQVANRVLRLMICVSPSLREHYLARGIRSDLCRVIPNGVDIALQPQRSRTEVRRSLGVAEDALLVGTVGSLLALKRVDILLDACAIAGAQLPGLRCVVVGAGPMEREWRERAERLGIADRVVFAGFRDDAFDCIHAFDIFVLSSRQEGMPRVVLEAMLAGKPVVGTDVVGTRDLVKDGENGYLVPLDRPDLMANRLLQLARDQQLRERLGADGQRRVKKSFSLEAYASSVAGALERIAAGAKA